jgi:hypothetical protein
VIGVRIFVFVSVVICQKHAPFVPFVVIPVVIVLVIPIVDSYLNIGFLRYGRGQQRNGRRQSGG